MQPASVTTGYRQTLDYLYTRLPMFSRIGAAAIKHDLTNTLKLCAALGNPQKHFKCIHIAGTNGKGSTSHMLAAVFQDAGYKTGLYTSPHLVDFRERIRINGVPVSEDFVCRFVEKIRPHIEAIEPSFFEITVAMAFTVFAEEGVDMAVIETGLGGRLDSTNIITPELSIITNISLDHTDLLGSTVAEIAVEKAGIIKQCIPVVVGKSDDESGKVFRQTALSRDAQLYNAGSAWSLVPEENRVQGKQHFKALQALSGIVLDIETDLTGSYQQENIATILTAVDVLAAQGWKLSAHKAAGALKSVKSSTGLRGRWDVLLQQPLVIADVAHNPAGLEIVLHDWSNIEAYTKHIILGFVRDKDVQKALSLFPPDATYHFCAAQIPRALPAEQLAALGKEAGLSGHIYSSVEEAVKHVRKSMHNKDALLITGSFFIVGEAMTVLDTD